MEMDGSGPDGKESDPLTDLKALKSPRIVLISGSTSLDPDGEFPSSAIKLRLTPSIRPLVQLVSVSLYISTTAVSSLLVCSFG